MIWIEDMDNGQAMKRGSRKTKQAALKKYPPIVAGYLISASEKEVTAQKVFIANNTLKNKP